MKVERTKYLNKIKNLNNINTDHGGSSSNSPSRPSEKVVSSDTTHEFQSHVCMGVYATCVENNTA